MFLHDCVCKDASQTELFIVAAGPLDEAAREGRNRLTQAVLVIDKTIACGGDVGDALANDQCQSIVATLGVGVQLSPDEPMGMERLRYGSVIIVTDQSEEGIHIRNEVFRFLYIYSRQILEENRVFVLEEVPEPGFTQEEFDVRILEAENRQLRSVVVAETLEATLIGIQ